MNYADPNKPTRLFIPQPFASGSGAAYTPIGVASGDNVNFVDGFPSAYGAPASGGGKFITRGEMNAIGRLASQNEFYRACGGINTFDAALAVAIGGYPMYAVLQYREGTDVFNVISLKDNNMVDFTGQTPTDAQYEAGIRIGTVDGENWGFCNVNTNRTGNQVIMRLPESLYGGMAETTSSDGNAIVNNLGIFKAPRTGNIIVAGSYKNNPHFNQTTGAAALNAGCMMFKEFDDRDDALEWCPSKDDPGNLFYMFAGKQAVNIIGYTWRYNNGSMRPFPVYTDKYYSVYYAIYSGGMTESDPVAYYDCDLRLELQAGV